jgi:guanine nucleotide-binding protein subunit alpha
MFLMNGNPTGKSTLQKQFQIYYAFKSLERELPCWRPVVFFNIIKALRIIFNELEYQFSEYGKQSLEAPQAVQDQLSEYRTKLLPLISLEDSLASQLSGGVTIGSGGQTEAFVRSGWQTLVGGSPASDVRAAEAAARTAEVSTLAARTLVNSVNDIQTLWHHPTVKLLFHDRKIRLDESASL